MAIKEKKGINILHVDDDPTFLNLTKYYLEQNKNEIIHVNSFSNPLKALEYLQNASCDIIISDYQMPPLNGLELLEKLRKQQNQTHFILFTGRGREEVVIKALNLGASYYIKKGIDIKSQFKELLHQIETIMQHKRTKKALELSESKSKAIFDVIPDLVLQIRKDGTILSYSYDGAIEDLYTSPENFLGHKIQEVLPKDIGSLTQFHIKQALQTGQMQIYEYELPLANRIRPTEARMIKHEEDKVLLIVRDMTQQKQAEKLRRENENQLRSILETTPVPVIVARKEDGRILYANPQCSPFIGLSHDKFVGKKASDFYYDSDERQKLKELLAKHGEIQNYEFHGIKAGGSEFWALLFMRPLLFEKQQAICTTLIDITQNKNAQQLLENQKRELSEFAHIIAHDLRSYLVSIDGYAFLLKDDYQPNFIDKIQKLVGKANSFLRQSVNLAEAGLVVQQAEHINLHDLISEAANITIPATVNFNLSNLPIVKADHQNLLQVFKNLFDNAVRHGKPNTINVKVKKMLDSIVIKVMNDGTRISLAKKKLIQEQQTKGWGLSIINKIISAYGWKITLEEYSDRDEKSFTSFSLDIPNLDIVSFIED